MDDTVLHIAARNNSLNDALVFLQNGALIDLKGDLGYTHIPASDTTAKVSTTPQPV